MPVKTVVAALLAASILSAAGARAADLPRYKLAAGEVLTYDISSTNQATGRPAAQSAGTEQLIVTGADGDGWKVVVITREHALPPATQPAAAPGADDVELGTGTIYPDGHTGAETLSSPNPQGLYLQLPATERDTAGYSTRGPSGGTYAVKVTDESPKAVTLDATLSAPMFQLYHVTQSLTVTIDPVRGVVTRTAAQSAMDNDGRKSHGSAVTTLRGIEQKEPAWAAKIGSDVDALNAANTAYYKVAQDMTGDAAVMNAALAQALATFTAAKANVTTPEVLAEFDGEVKQHRASQKYMVKEAQQSATVLNKPAPDWTLDRVGGGDKIALKDLRGKVVLLDFWYKDCPWCIRAMPVINQMYTDYQNKGVAVIGMNVDQKESDAQLTIDTVGLKYPSVKTSYDFAKSCGVSVYPTLIVIDQEGIVRKIDTGYSTTLRKDLGAFVDGLLKGNGA